MPDTLLANVNADNVTKYFDRLLIHSDRPELVYAKFGQQRPIPLNNGRTVTFRIIDALTPNTTPIAEMTDPTPRLGSTTEVSATLSKYEDAMRVSEETDIYNPKGTMTELVKEMGQLAHETQDLIIRDGIMGGGTIVYGGEFADANVDTRAEVVVKPTVAEFKKIYRMMRKNKVPFVTEIAKGGIGQGTQPVPKAYYAVVSAECAFDIQELDGWIPVEEYPSKVDLFPGEIGALKCGFRIVSTTQAPVIPDAGGAVAPGFASTTGVNMDIHPILIFGKKPFGYCPLGKGNIETVMKDKDHAGSMMRNWSLFGWKFKTTVKVLKTLSLVQYEVAVSE